MKPLEDFLVKKGFTVYNIDLPGHNSTPTELESIRWTDWIDYAQKRLNTLKSQCSTVYISGISMGGVIALYLCSTNKDLAGIITFSTAVKPFNFISWFVYLFRPIQYIYRWIKVGKHREKYVGTFTDWHGYDKLPMSALIQGAKLLDNLSRKLKHITLPILIIHSVNDRVVLIKGMNQIVKAINSEDKTLAEIHEGGHLILLDKGSTQALKEIEEWLEQRI